MSKNVTKIDDLLEKNKEYGVSVKLNRIMYFDESNNIKKAIIGKEKDNNADLENLCFVLGGVALKKELKFDELLKYVGARQCPVDAKFNFFAFKKSKFEDAIAQSRLRRFFEYLLKENILIHFMVLHYFHFALTDILDSLIEENDANQDAAMLYYHNLQSDMTEVLYQTFDDFHDLLIDFEFPNVPKERANEFINRISEMYIDNLSYFDLDDIDNFTKVLLAQIIKAKRDKNNLVFLENNKPFVIADGVQQDYFLRMVEFKDKKYFDNELTISHALEEMDVNYSRKLNVEFWDSVEHREIQICDVICGFVGRLYNFLSHNSYDDIAKFCFSLDVESESFKTLHTFFELMTMSDNVSPVCFKKITPIFIESRLEVMECCIMKRQK